MHISQILKTKPPSVVTGHPSDTVGDIVEQLSQNKIGAVVILDDDGKVVGIISERDIIRLIAAHGAASLNMSVSQGMTHGVITCTRQCLVEEIMRVMTKGRFRHIPVVEDGRLIGIISIGDVVKYRNAEFELEVSAMRDYLATG